MVNTDLFPNSCLRQAAPMAALTMGAKAVNIARH
jgi:hypothetical protein